LCLLLCASLTPTRAHADARDQAFFSLATLAGGDAALLLSGIGFATAAELTHDDPDGIPSAIRDASITLGIINTTIGTIGTISFAVILAGSEDSVFAIPTLLMVSQLGVGVWGIIASLRDA